MLESLNRNQRKQLFLLLRTEDSRSFSLTTDSNTKLLQDSWSSALKLMTQVENVYITMPDRKTYFASVDVIILLLHETYSMRSLSSKVLVPTVLTCVRNQLSTTGTHDFTYIIYLHIQVIPEWN